ncbi:hypothetical protein [Leifsonia poae]|uniref:hypothetical protein n=1 Tax=Leifsonia poae TaxID=110933 RepID=UPI003D671E87
MTNPDDVELQIMLEMLQIIRSRRQPDPPAHSTLSDILHNLPEGISIGTIVGAIVEPGVSYLGDTYRTGQALNVGPGATVSGGSFAQLWADNSADIDLPTLAAELRVLRAEGRSRATGDASEDESLGALASAQRAAEDGDGPRAIGFLKSAGKWALDVGTQVGVSMAVKALTVALGFPPT